MQGTILIIDGTVTHRIMLKVQLTSACYKVVQAEALAGLDEILNRCRPDLVISAMNLPDGSVVDLLSKMARKPGMRAVPVVATAEQNDRHSRLNALEAGISEVLHHPIDDTILQARIRSLLRSRSTVEELQQAGGTATAIGFAEVPQPFAATTTRVALVGRQASDAVLWREKLQSRVPFRLASHRFDDIASLMSGPVPDAVVIGMDAPSSSAALGLIADLRARASTRDAVLIAVPNPASAQLAAEALDRGAHDALHFGFCVSELALRLRKQLRLKARSDRYRDNMRCGLEAAMTDYLTKLHNRRYIRHRIDCLSREAENRKNGFALLAVDLDFFKSVNDRFGHPAGDSVLIETADRLRRSVESPGMVARVGGEEFVVVLPDTSVEQAHIMAEKLRQEIGSVPFTIAGHRDPINVTASIGLVLGPPPHSTGQAETDTLMFEADKALYCAKHAGRNQVCVGNLRA